MGFFFALIVTRPSVRFISEFILLRTVTGECVRAKLEGNRARKLK